MALQALWAPETQFQNKNGSLLVSGKIYVKYRGRSQLARTYRDSEGTYLNTNPLLTDNDGRVLCFADDAFSYTAVVCDFYGNELFSFDPIPCGSGSGSSSSSSAQHWIGINGQTQQVSRNTYTRLKLPSGIENVDYKGDFVLGTIKGSGTEMVLKDGLYLVNAVIRFKQSSDDLTNTLSNVIIHTRDFDTPNIQEVGAVVRDEAGPDASDDIHTITLTYIRHVSEGDVGSDRIKFAVETPNTWTECYIQNLQIAKLGSSGGESVTPTVYYAGDYINIENDTISVTGIEPDNYATHDELHSATSAFITSADLPSTEEVQFEELDLSSYATEQWVLDKHYITSADIPSIPEDLVTSAELAHTSGLIEKDIADMTSSISESLAGKMDKSSSADFYPRHGNPDGYLTSIPSEYVTDSEMSGYVQDHTSAFITSADIPDIPDDVVTSAELATVSGEIVNQIPSLQGYATEEYVTEHTSAFLTSADLPDVSDMATKTWVGEQGYLTSVPSEYITETELESAISGKADTSAIPDVSNFVTQEDIDASVSGKMDATESSAFYPMATNPSGYLVGTDLNGYATEQYVQDETSAFLTPADLPITEEVQFEELDLSGYATESYVASAVSGKQDALTFGYDSSDKINAINGSAIAGGGGGGSYTAGEFIDITNDVISVNSGDVSNLIPGSGILITQSSAGTTVSIDPEEMPKNTHYETVLWEGENGELISAHNYSVNLSDDPLSYNRIGVYGRPNENAGCQNYIEFDPSYSAICKTVTPYYNENTLVMDINTYSFSGTNKMTVVSQTHIAGTTSFNGGLWIYKVVGINKKES